MVRGDVDSTHHRRDLTNDVVAPNRPRDRDRVALADGSGRVEIDAE